MENFMKQILRRLEAPGALEAFCDNCRESCSSGCKRMELAETRRRLATRATLHGYF